MAREKTYKPIVEDDFEILTRDLNDNSRYTDRILLKNHKTEKEYILATRKSDGRKTCGCKHWIMRCNKAGTDCKHIKWFLDSDVMRRIQEMLKKTEITEAVFEQYSQYKELCETLVNMNYLNKETWTNFETMIKSFLGIGVLNGI